MASTGAVQSAELGVAVAQTRSGRATSRGRAPRGRFISGATLLSGVVIAAGWWRRDESNWVADEGVGYGLGIVGLSCLVSLLLYSLRKRMRALRSVGRISSWFQIHMLLGLAGPVAILYHCNFHLGSLNSNVALLCALVVAASGVVGRVIYTRIHYGLSDRRTTLEDVREEVGRARRAIAQDDLSSDLGTVLDEFEGQVTRHKRNALDGIWCFVALGHRCRRARRRALRSLRRSTGLSSDIAAARRELRVSIRRYIGAVRRTETLGVYESFFSLWHVLHLPLACLLFVAAAVHVIAVHMY